MGGQVELESRPGLDALHARAAVRGRPGRRRRSYLRERDEICRRTVLIILRCVRPTLVVAALCFLPRSPAPAGCSSRPRTATGLVVGTQTVLVREPLVRGRAPVDRSSSRSRCSPAASSRSGSSPSAPPGVVTVFSYFGAKPGGSTLEQGSGFVVDRDGRHPHRRARDRLDHRPPRRVQTPAHMPSTSSSATATGCRPQIVGWDPYDDVGVLRVEPAAHALDAGAARQSRPTSRSASRSRRSARRSATRPRSRSVSSPAPTARSPR